MLLSQCSCSYAPEPVSFGGVGYYAPGLNASIDAYHGVATGGPIFANLPGRSVEFVSRRNDRAPGIIFRSERWVDGGVVLQVNAQNCGNSSPVFAVTADGIAYGGAFNPDCSGNADPYAGALVHAGYAGSVALYSARDYLTVAGSLGAIRAVLPDGGQPNPADYPSGWVRCDAEGCHFPYAGLHGSVNSAARVPMYAGQLGEWHNRTDDDGFHAHKAGIDWLGGYWQNHGLTRAQFPSPRVETTETSVGQYRFAMLSTLRFAFDTLHWYFNAADSYVQLAEQPEVDALRTQVTAQAALISALEARVAALEAQHP